MPGFTRSLRHRTTQLGLAPNLNNARPSGRNHNPKRPSRQSLMIRYRAILFYQAMGLPDFDLTGFTVIRNREDS